MINFPMEMVKYLLFIKIILVINNNLFNYIFEFIKIF